MSGKCPHCDSCRRLPPKPPLSAASPARIGGTVARRAGPLIGFSSRRGRLFLRFFGLLSHACGSLHPLFLHSHTNTHTHSHTVSLSLSFSCTVIFPPSSTHTHFRLPPCLTFSHVQMLKLFEHITYMHIHNSTTVEKRRISDACSTSISSLSLSL